MQRAYGTLKQNLVKFLNSLKSVTQIINQLDRINWHRNYANLSSFSRQTQDVVVPKEYIEVFRKVSYNFCRFSRKNV